MTSPDPRRGAPARFGPENVTRGLRASVTGEIFSLNLELDDPIVPFNRGRFERTNRLHNDTRPQPDGRAWVINDDEIHVALQGSSQWDSFAHVGVMVPGEPGIFLGGAGLEETAGGNAPTLGIQALGPGIVARGVLLDLVAALGDGRDWLDGAMRVGRSEVERVIDSQGVRIEPGDVVLLYTGFERLRASVDGAYPADVAGLNGTTVALWEELDILALVADNPGIEASPPDFDLHIGMLTKLGIPLGELWALDALALACRADGRYDFTLASVPLAIHGAFGSTANAIAIR